MSPTSLVRRLATVHWPLAAVCAAFLVAGALVLDDYNVSPDEADQRAVGQAALDYLAGEGERAFDQLRVSHNRYYGAVFEAPLALLERIPGLEDPRDVSLGRNAFTHLFFLAGGVFCYLLVLRLFNSRRFFIQIYPADLSRNHPAFSEDGGYGFREMEFNFRRYGARIDGDCVAVAPLPDYPIARIETGQRTPG